MKPSGAPASALAEEEGVAAGVTAAPTPVHSPTYTALATFASAGLGNVLSATVTNPFDVIKIRQQLLFDRSRANFISVTRGMLANEGVVGLWAGVTASCLREGTYSTIRMGGYEPCKRMIGTVIPETTFANKLAAGVVSGAVGAALSTPTDLMKVRMQAARGPSNRPPYRTTFHGFAEVYSSGGLKALWRGVYPNTIRAAILTSSQIATYDEVKGWFKRTLGFTEGFRLHFSASMVAGFVCSAASSPVDVIKVRIMSEAAKSSSASSMSLLGALLKDEGPAALFKGFGMCWMRLGTHTVVSLVLFEAFRSALGIKPL